MKLCIQSRDGLYIIWYCGVVYNLPGVVPAVKHYIVFVIPVWHLANLRIFHLLPLITYIQLTFILEQGLGSDPFINQLMITTVD